MSMSQGFRDYLAGVGEPHNFLVGLLTIEHEDPAVLPSTLRLNWLTDRVVVSRGEKFYPSGFDLVLPSLNDGESTTTLALPLSSHFAVGRLGEAKTPFDVTLELVLTGTPDEVELSMRFRDRGRSYLPAAHALAVTLRFRDVLFNPRPKERYTPTRFAALFRS